MTLVDMKRTKKEAKEAENVSVGYEEQYPWGLQITLGNEELNKLKLDLKNLNVGDSVAIMAAGKVTRISISDEFKNTSKSLGIQIQKIALDFQETDELDWNTSADMAEKVLAKRGIIG